MATQDAVVSGFAVHVIGLAYAMLLGLFALGIQSVADKS
jgi:hypothetical protein